MTARVIVKELEAAKKSGVPFFIAAGFHRPHTPYTAPKKYFDMYPLESIKLPVEPADDRNDIPALSLRRNRPDPTLTPEQRRKAVQGYYASITFMDAQAGLLLDALDRLELTSSTVIVFFGDHGQHLGEHGGLYRKTSLFEQAARAPLIFAGAGVTLAGEVCKHPVQFLDIFPTLTELCGLPSNPVAEGHSLGTLLREPQAEWPHAAVTTLAWDGIVGHTIRTAGFRYSEWDGGNQGRELYDHSKDPEEHKNLASDPAYREVVTELHNKIEQTVKAPEGKTDAGGHGDGKSGKGRKGKAGKAGKKAKKQARQS